MWHLESDIRPSWNLTYMNMCKILSNRSTCLRIQTASIIIRNNIIISVGYNGTASKQKHCRDFWKHKYEHTFSDHNLSWQTFLQSEFFYKEHHKWSNLNELHGEMNAILFAGKNGISLDNSTLYTIYSPCINCSKAILTSGIQKVVYSKLYKRQTDGIEFLKDRGIQVEHFELD